MKCPECEGNLKVLETRKTRKWLRRRKVCPNRHIVMTRQMHDSQTETIVPRRNSAPNVKRVLSSVCHSESVEGILMVWSKSAASEEGNTSSE